MLLSLLASLAPASAEQHMKWLACGEYISDCLTFTRFILQYRTRTYVCNTHGA